MAASLGPRQAEPLHRPSSCCRVRLPQGRGNRGLTILSCPSCSCRAASALLHGAESSPQLLEEAFGSGVARSFGLLLAPVLGFLSHTRAQVLNTDSKPFREDNSPESKPPALVKKPVAGAFYPLASLQSSSPWPHCVSLSSPSSLGGTGAPPCYREPEPVPSRC